jgi:biotin operon repressor
MMPGMHINCSEGGILRENILNMPLRFCADRYLKAEYDIESMLFVKEAVVDNILASVEADISQYRQILMVLLDGPSLPNLAMRVGKSEPEVVELISTLRAHGLAIHEGTTAIPAPDGTQVEVITFLLQGVLDADTGSNMRTEGQQEFTGQELVQAKG